MDISGHDGNSLGVDGTKIGVLEKTNQIGFRSLLESKDSRALESEFLVEVTSDLSDESLERKLSEKKISGLLISSDFSKGDGTWSESVWLLNAGSGWSGLFLYIG